MKLLKIKQSIQRKIVFIAIFFSLVSFQLSADNIQMKKNINDITKIYMSSMTYIFKSQSIINQKNVDKSSLFGDAFIENIKQTYSVKYNEDFPKADHLAKKMLLQVMVEVMDDNKELIHDNEIGFKGVIPATYASQLSAKLATKGIGLTIKFTRTEKGIRNILNKPDAWESAVMEKMKTTPDIYYDENALLNGKAAIRQFTPLPMAPLCLGCHGVPGQNPLNVGKDKSQWTTIDITGFEMENWTIDDFGGGVSISIEKSVLQ
ncbi:MAG: DUF3365 domain-containing protein [Colwellia sp.]|nr:DUF3365 domain-containing protein [Colwellia sp.]